MLLSLANNKDSGIVRGEQLKWLHPLDTSSRFVREEFIDDGKASLKDLEFLLNWYDFWKNYYGDFIVNVDDLKAAIESRK